MNSLAGSGLRVLEKQGNLTAEDLEIFNAMPVLFSVRNRDGKYLWVNNAVEEAANTEVVGKTDNDLPWADHHQYFLELDHEVYNSGESKLVRSYVFEDYETGKVYDLLFCKWLDFFHGQKAIFALFHFVPVKD